MKLRGGVPPSPTPKKMKNKGEIQTEVAGIVATPSPTPKKIKNKGEIQAEIAGIVAIIILLFFATFISSTVYKAATGGGNCYVNSSGIYNCSMSLTQFQMLNSTDVNAGTSFRLLSLYPIVAMGVLMILAFLTIFIRR